MTEAEWLACEDPEKMLEFLKGKASDRKVRLFGCACCRRIWHLMKHTESQEAVILSERFADGVACEDDMLAAHESAFVNAEAMLNAWSKAATEARQRLNGRHDLTSETVNTFWIEFREHAKANLNGSTYYAAAWASGLQVHPEDVSRESADAAAGYSAAPGDDYRDSTALDTERSAQAALVRDIFGSIPLRTIRRTRKWLTSDVRSLAEGIYQDCAFDRMPILADALQDAGCDNEDILNHCRSEGVHVRGCWCVDLVLGKE
jgi:hypothetical protein